jgi:hypothetical protein
MNPGASIVLTGGPGGGKTTLIEELAHDPARRRHFVALPEAILLMGSVGISPREKLFQREMLHLQMALEDGLARALGPHDPRMILCERGSLDPLAYWLERGWPAEEFFAFTATTWEEHYRRYTAVVHMVTAADGALEAYWRRPDAHRPEEPEEAVRIDRLLEQVWSGHPRYLRIGNEEHDWPTKAAKARGILAELCGDT